jgi:ABC-type branched-subunit amino acid transport system substrate-binding protein
MWLLTWHVFIFYIGSPKEKHMVGLIVLVLFSSQCVYTVAAKDIYCLKTFQAIAKELPEFPHCDILDWVDPNYDTFLNSIKISFTDALLYKIGLKDKKKSVSFLLTDILEKMLADTPAMPPECNGLMLSVKPETKLFIWADVHAAYHSLLRDFEWLAKQQVIDEDLCVLQDCYLIFFGDAIDEGPYSMATLCFILSLMHKNPSKVIYIKGDHESNHYWENFGLKREIRIINQHMPYNYAKLIDNINALFDLLPTYLLVHTTDDAKSTLFFTFNGMKKPYINLNLDSSKPECVNHVKIAFQDFYTDNALIMPDVVFKTQEWRQEHCAQDGLGQLEQEAGATTWAIISSPIITHQKISRILNDAFGCVTLHSSVRTSTIQLINKYFDHGDFVKHEECNLFTGRLVSHPHAQARGNDLIIGSTMPLSQGFPVISKAVKHGASLAVLEQNQIGGIHGRQVRLDVRDDYYFPLTARSNVEDFMKRNIDFIAMPVGSPTLKAYLDFVEEGKLAVIFPITGDTAFADPSLTHLASLTAMHTEEVTALVNYFTRNQVVKNFAFVYQEDEYGKDTLELAHSLLEKKGIVKWIDIPCSRGSIEFGKQVEKIKESTVDAICFLCTAEAGQEFIRKFDVEYLNSKVLFGLSTLTSNAFKSFIEKRGVRFYFSSRVPNAKTSMLPIVKEYRRLMNTHYYGYDNFSLESYIGMKLLLTLLQQLPEHFTKEDVLKSIEKLHKYKFEGFVLSFKQSDRSLDMSVWINKGEDVEWLEVVDPSKKSV